MDSQIALVQFLESARLLTGAAGASLGLMPCSGPEVPPLVLHSGSLPPVPELADEAALLHHRRSLQEGGPEVVEQIAVPGVVHYPSVIADGHILRFSATAFAAALRRELTQGLVEKRREDLQETPARSEKWVWLGLRFAVGAESGSPEGFAITPSAGNDRQGVTDGLKWGVALGGGIMWALHELSALLQDPVCQLPGRVEFQARFTHLLKQAVTRQEPLGLMLINPDDFSLINQRLGPELGDSTLHEVAVRIRDSLRQSDAVFRYGGAVFAALLPAAGAVESKAAADKLRYSLTRGSYSNRSVRLTFSMGLAVYEPRGQADDMAADSAELLREADRALNTAKLSGGGCTLAFGDNKDDTHLGNLDRLSGIFTADTEKDYRNMLLLWDTVTFISSHAEPEIIARVFLERVSAIFKPSRSVLFTQDGQGRPNPLADTGLAAGPPSRGAARSIVGLPTEQRHQLLEKARQQHRIIRQRIPDSTWAGKATRHLLVYVVPMLFQDVYQGCLYFEGPEGAFTLDSSDLVFLNALANQVAVALDRAQLAAKWKSEQERERSRLKQELHGLRLALGQSQLIFQSEQMQDVVNVLKRVGPTEATVLVTGESGTGKEGIARMVHQLSPRKGRPFITVDCGSIAKTLLEAELFGYVKGAFTGADTTSPGRITQADGGTLFLDEIGELPLDIQSKLLRFVQEKEIKPVGSANFRLMDVRIVAATNRNLVTEVARGRFRRDLYFRLQVITVIAPPLRARPDDILPIAYHYLEKYSIQYDKEGRYFSAEAEMGLREYHWPGNVRELQNRVLQAVIMSNRDEIDADQLGLDTARPEGEADPAVPAGGYAADSRASAPVEAGPVSDAVADDALHGNPASPAPDVEEDAWDALRRGLEHQLNATLAAGSGSLLPLARWLTEDLVLAADAQNARVARRAGAALGMAETTFRRHLHKAKTAVRAGNSNRGVSWAVLEPIFPRLIDSAGGQDGINVIDKARDLLLQLVANRLSDNDGYGAAIMDVTLPTYRRRLEHLRA